MKPSIPFCRRICMAVAFSLLAVNTAVAADPINPVRFDAGPADPIETWSGFYLGASLDAQGNFTEIDRGAGIGKFQNGTLNLLPGVHFGYNFKPFGNYATGGWLFGVETDLVLGNLKSRKRDAVLGTVKREGNFVATARGRGGFAWRKLYLYGTAGLAVSNYNATPLNYKNKVVNLGLVAGLGAEFKFNDQWSMRAEALSFSYGERNYTFNGVKRKVNLGTATIRVGVSRKF